MSLWQPSLHKRRPMYEKNGSLSQDTMKVIKEYLSDGKKVPVALKDSLLFGALVQLYDIAEMNRRSINGIKPWVDLFKWSAITIGPLIIVMLFGMLTHTFTWPF